MLRRDLLIDVCRLAACGGVARSVRGRDDQRRAPARLCALFWHDSPNDAEALEGVRVALREAAFPHELVVKQAGGESKRVMQLLAEVSDERYDLLLAMGTQAALLARERFTTLPIVYAAVTNPVASAVVPTWGGSGRNLAGCSNWIAPETVLHVFRLAVAKLGRLGVLRSPEKVSGVVSAAELAAMRELLRRPGSPALEIVEAVAGDERELGAAVKRLLAARVDAIWIPIDITVYQNMPLVREALGSARVPLVSSSLQGARNGAVAGVHVDYRLHGRMAGALVIEVLSGKRPIGAIPVRTMQSYQVVVNLDAARASGYEPPLSLLALADLLIDDGGVAASRSSDGK